MIKIEKVEQLSQERQDLICFLEGSLSDLAPVGRPSLRDDDDYLADLDPALQVAKRIGTSIGRNLGKLSRLLERKPSFQEFHYKPTEADLREVSGMQAWEKNPNYILIRLMRLVIDVLEKSPAETLEQDVFTCMDQFAKEHPHFAMNIDRNFLNSVGKCARAELR